MVYIIGTVLAMLVLLILCGISDIKDEINRMNIKLNKIEEQVGVTYTITDEVRILIEEGKKVEAIKKYRSATGIGLKEGKEYIDSL